jgi:subtilisin family serine protease
MHSRDLANVISVGAHDKSEKAARFSNGVGASRAIQIDAPGVGIYSTLPNDRVGQLSGTSMAAPHVAGVAALALSANTNLTAADLKALLTAGADRPVRDSDALGGLDAANSVARARSGDFGQSGWSGDSAATTSGYVMRQSAPVRFLDPSDFDRDRVATPRSVATRLAKSQLTVAQPTTVERRWYDSIHRAVFTRGESSIDSKAVDEALSQFGEELIEA